MSQAIFTSFFIIGMVIVVPTGVSNAGSWDGGPPYKTDEVNDGSLGHYQEKPANKNIIIYSWSPEVIDDVYVNDTVGQNIEYSITTSEKVTDIEWTIDGLEVAGIESGNTSSYMHEWNKVSIGSHTIRIRGSSMGSKVDFRWYVDVQENNGKAGGSVFDVINDMLENELLDIKIRMFKYQISKNGDFDIAFQKISSLNDEMGKRRIVRESLRDEFKNGDITIDEYVASLRQAQRETKHDVKFAKEMAKFALELKNENLSREFEKTIKK